VDLRFLAFYGGYNFNHTTTFGVWGYFSHQMLGQIIWGADFPRKLTRNYRDYRLIFGDLFEATPPQVVCGADIRPPLRGGERERGYASAESRGRSYF